MKAKTCPICGKASLHQKHGEYRMELPSTAGSRNERTRGH
jgi:rRNA maturation protein Nop10